MRFDLNQEVKKRSFWHKRKQRWYKRVSALAAVVVFCTTYALILPAITMEKQVCELEEHTHSDACYVPFVEQSWLELKACSLEAHIHTDDCAATEGCESMENADFVVHTHDEVCYDRDGRLLCELEELELHRHTDACYEIDEAPAVSPGPSVEEPPVEEPPAEEPPVEEPSVEDPPVEEPSVEEPPAEEPPVEEPPVEEPSVEEPPVEEPSVEEPPVEEPSVEEPSVEEPGAEENDTVVEEIIIQDVSLAPAVLMAAKPVRTIGIAAEAPAEEPSVEDTPVEEAPVEEVPVEEPSAETPSVAEPPAEDAPAEEAPSAPAYSDVPLCGMDELELHTHSEDCLDENGDVICGDPQVIRHQHGEQCLRTVCTEPDLAILECGAAEGGETPPEDSADAAPEAVGAHVHDESCYSYWMLGCGKREHTHTANCGIVFEANLELENDAMLLKLQVFDSEPLPEDLSFDLRNMSRDDAAYAPYADYAVESTPGELRTLSAYEIVFFSAGQEIPLPNAEIVAEMTVKELEIPEAEDFAPLAAGEPAEEIPAGGPASEEIVVQTAGLEAAALMSDGAEAAVTLAEEPAAESDDTAYQMHLTVLSSDPGGVSGADSATVESTEDIAPVMYMSLGSSRTFALARSVEPLPKFDIHYICNMLRYYDPANPELYLKVINTARTDGSYPVEGVPLGGLLPVNGGGVSASPNGNAIYNLALEQSSTHPGYYRTAMQYELVEVYQAQENVIYSNAMTSRHMNVLRENSHYGVIYIQMLPAGETDWTKAVQYNVNWDSNKGHWENVDVVDDPNYVWEDVDNLYYFTNNPDAATDDQGREPIVITDGMTLRYVYFPTSAEESFDAGFYDYDISDGTHTVSGNVTTMDTFRQGINASSNYRNGTGSAHLAFGNSNTGSGWQTQTMNRDGVGNKLNQYNGSSYGKGFEGLTFGIVKGYDYDTGRLIYNDNVTAPYLFSYTDGNTVNGKTSYDNTDMVFRRDGDTYTLTRVQGSDGIYAENLELFATTYKNTSSSGTKHLVSNSFWPFDGINNGVNGHDIHFGNYSDYDNARKKFSGRLGDGTTANSSALPLSDAYPSSAAVDHNSYFGLEYAVDFHLDGSYTGPLEYLFYGDDDMWVFLTDHTTGQTNLIADIGGVHSSVGSYTDLWDWVPNTADRPNGKGDYTLHFFYTERGASGSSCFMQFTIPDAVGVPQQSTETGSVEVEKVLAGGMTTDEDFRFEYAIEYPSGLSDAEKDRILPYTILDASGQVVSGALFREGQFELKAGQRIIIGNIPVGSDFSVSEEVTDGSDYVAEWTTVPDSASMSGGTVTGTIEKGGQTLAFECTNTYNSLTLTKKVVVDEGFTVPENYVFDVVLKNSLGLPLTGTINTVTRAANGDYGDPVAVTLDGGKVTVVLKENESISFFPLPDGATYTITETDKGSLLPHWSIGSGDEVFNDSTSGTVESGNVAVTCTNRGGFLLPETGGAGTTLYTMGGLLLMAAAVLLGYTKIRKEARPS